MGDLALYTALMLSLLLLVLTLLSPSDSQSTAFLLGTNYLSKCQD